MKKALFSSAIIFSFLSIFSAVTLAQSKSGEIININYKYKIAFSDLTESQVRLGDKVGVKLSDGAVVYLEALEVYPVMVKLSVSGDPAYALTDQQFAKISVGNVVVLQQDQGRTRPVSRPTVARQPVVSNKGTEENFDGPIETYQPKGPGSSVASSAERKLPSESRQDIPVEVRPSQPDQGDWQAKVDRLVENNMKLSEHITLLLSEKTLLEKALKDKEAECAIIQKKSDEALAANLPLQEKARSQDNEISRLQKEKADDQKEIQDLGLKFSQLKQKLARMAEIMKTQIKNYE